MLGHKKILKGSVETGEDNTFLIDLKNGEAKVTHCIVKAARNRYFGTYQNVSGIEIATVDGLFIAFVMKGQVGGVKKIDRMGRTLIVEFDVSRQTQPPYVQLIPLNCNFLRRVYIPHVFSQCIICLLSCWCNTGFNIVEWLCYKH